MSSASANAGQSSIGAGVALASEEGSGTSVHDAATHYTRISDNLARLDELLELARHAAEQPGMDRGRVERACSGASRDLGQTVQQYLLRIECALNEEHSRAQSDLEEAQERAQAETKAVHERQRQRVDRLFGSAKTVVEDLRSEARARVDNFLQQFQSQWQDVIERDDHTISNLCIRMKNSTREAQEELQRGRSFWLDNSPERSMETFGAPPQYGHAIGTPSVAFIVQRLREHYQTTQRRATTDTSP
ncbi:hypothetical protein OC835_005873 [Tilletia horrida]|nr:hypothetical protein OC835_005873 [Tilletia horrida]